MPPVARLTDTSSHGGEIVTASATVTVNGLGVARLGDTLRCPLHGDQPLVEASATVSADGLGVVRVGDKAYCEAIIETGSPNVSAD